MQDHSASVVLLLVVLFLIALADSGTITTIRQTLSSTAPGATPSSTTRYDPSSTTLPSVTGGSGVIGMGSLSDVQNAVNAGVLAPGTYTINGQPQQVGVNVNPGVQ